MDDFRRKAQLLMRKWHSESSLLKIIFGRQEFGTDLFGQIESLSLEEVHFISKSGRVRIKLTNAEFAYAEPREAVPAIKEAEEQRSIAS